MAGLRRGSYELLGRVRCVKQCTVHHGLSLPGQVWPLDHNTVSVSCQQMGNKHCQSDYPKVAITPGTQVILEDHHTRYQALGLSPSSTGTNQILDQACPIVFLPFTS